MQLDKSTKFDSKSNLICAPTVKLQGSDGVEETESGRKLHKYRGIISSTDYNTKFFRLSKETLKQVKTQANAGVPVYKNHAIFGWFSSEDPIGKSRSAKMYDEKVSSVFEILSGLTNPNTDELIDMIETDIMSALSIGFYGGDFRCDECNQLMDLGWFTPHCENGHYMGMKLKDKRVTATLEGDINLREYSVVDAGADKNAGITQKLRDMIDRLRNDIQGGLLNKEMVLSGSELIGVNFAILSQQLGDLGVSNEPENPYIIQGGDQMPKENEGAMSNASDRILTEQVDKLTQELEDLKENTVPVEQHKALQQELDELKANTETSKEDFEKELAEQKLLAEQGELALKLERQNTLTAYIKSRGVTLKDKENDIEYQSVAAQIETCMSVVELRTAARKFWKAVPVGQQHVSTPAIQELDRDVGADAYTRDFV